MFRIIRVPPSLDKFFQPLKGHVHWDHFAYFRLLVLTIACMWGRRNVANLYRYLDAEHHRTRFNTFFLVERWDLRPLSARRPRHCCAPSVPGRARPSMWAWMIPRKPNGVEQWTPSPR
jgi:hypothetical protein